MTDEAIPDTVAWPAKNKAVFGRLGLDESLALTFGGYLVIRDASSVDYNCMTRHSTPFRA